MDIKYWPQQQYNYSHIKGTDFILPFQLKSWGVPMDITGATFIFAMKKRPHNIDYILQNIPLIITDAINWKVKLELSDDLLDIENWEYYYDIQMVDSAWIVSIIMQWKINLTYKIN